MSDNVTTFCIECGPGVKVDEDGLCVLCGATATGTNLRYINRLRTRIEELERQVVLSGWNDFEGDVTGMYIITTAQINAAWEWINKPEWSHATREAMKIALERVGIEQCPDPLRRDNWSIRCGCAHNFVTICKSRDRRRE